MYLQVTFRCISGGLAVLFATLFLTEDLPKWCLMIWICLLFLVWCGVWAACPSVLAKLFGARNVSILYGMVDVASVSIKYYLYIILQSKSLNPFGQRVPNVMWRTHVHCQSFRLTLKVD